MSVDLTDRSKWLPKAAALELCQMLMGDYVCLEDGRVMRLDSYDCFTKCFTGRVMMQAVPTEKAVHVSKLLPKVRGGEVTRELRVMSGAFPLIERTPVVSPEMVLGPEAQC